MARLIFLCFLFTAIYGYSQETKPVLITGDFRGVTMDEFVRQIESKTSFRFYYDPAQIDSPLVSIRAEKEKQEAEQAHVRALIDYNNVRSAKKPVPWISGI